jgi:hypothetical protein
VVFALSNLPMKAGGRVDPNYRGIRSGYVIQFEDGYYAGARGGGWSYSKEGKRLQQFKGDGGGAHAKNFIDALRSRNSKMQNAEIEQTHYSSAWCHLANIAFRLGEKYSKDQAMEIARGYAPLQELMDGFEEHVKANEADLAATKVSSILELDPQKEAFTGPSATPQAKALLTREYRKPFVVPDQV